MTAKKMFQCFGMQGISFQHKFCKEQHLFSLMLGNVSILVSMLVIQDFGGKSFSEYARIINFKIDN